MLFIFVNFIKIKFYNSWINLISKEFRISFNFKFFFYTIFGFFFIFFPFIKTNYFIYYFVAFKLNFIVFLFFIIYWWFFVIFFTKDFFKFKFFFLSSNDVNFVENEIGLNKKEEIEKYYSVVSYNILNNSNTKFTIKKGIIFDHLFRKFCNDNIIYSKAVNRYIKKFSEKFVFNYFYLDLFIVIWFIFFFCKTIDPFYLIYHSESFLRNRFRDSRISPFNATKKSKSFVYPFIELQLTSKHPRTKVMFVGDNKINSNFNSIVKQYYFGKRILFSQNMYFYFQKYYYSFIKNFFNLYYTNFPLSFDFFNYYSEFNIFRHKISNLGFFSKEKIVLDVVDSQYANKRFNPYEFNDFKKKRWFRRIKKWKTYIIGNASNRTLYKNRYLNFYLIKENDYKYRKPIYKYVLGQYVYDSKRSIFNNFFFNHSKSYFTSKIFYEKAMIPFFKKKYLLNKWSASENFNFYLRDRWYKKKVRVQSFDFSIINFASSFIKNSTLAYWLDFFFHDCWEKTYPDKQDSKNKFFLLNLHRHRRYVDHFPYNAVYTFLDPESGYYANLAKKKNINRENPYYLRPENKIISPIAKKKYYYPIRNYNLDYYFINLRRIRYYNAYNYKYYRFSILPQQAKYKKHKNFFDILDDTFTAGPAKQKKKKTYNYMQEQYYYQIKNYNNFLYTNRRIKLYKKIKNFDYFFNTQKNKYKEFYFNMKRINKYFKK